MEIANNNNLKAMFDKNFEEELRKEKEIKVKEETFTKDIVAYETADKSYQTIFSPNFTDNRTTSISDLNRVASTYYTTPNASLAEDILKGKQDEIAKVAKD